MENPVASVLAVPAAAAAAAAAAPLAPKKRGRPPGSKTKHRSVAAVAFAKKQKKVQEQLENKKKERERVAAARIFRAARRATPPPGGIASIAKVSKASGVATSSSALLCVHPSSEEVVRPVLSEPQHVLTKTVDMLNAVMEFSSAEQHERVRLHEELRVSCVKCQSAFEDVDARQEELTKAVGALRASHEKISRTMRKILAAETCQNIEEARKMQLLRQMVKDHSDAVDLVREFQSSDSVAALHAVHAAGAAADAAESETSTFSD